MTKQTAEQHQLHLHKIANRALENGVITRQFILIECCRIERILLNAGYTFVTPPRLYLVDKIPSPGKNQACYGHVNVLGIITINEIYIGTVYVNALRNTIVHELAHASIGIDQQHNPAFKKRLKEFGLRLAIPENEARAEGSKLYKHYRDKHQPPKYKLYMVTESGVRHFYKYAERKQRQYSEFALSGSTATVGSEKIVRFEYERHQVNPL